MKELELFLGESDTIELEQLAKKARERGVKTTGHTWQILDWITEQVTTSQVERFILSGGGFYCLLSATTFIVRQGKPVTIDLDNCVIDDLYTHEFNSLTELFLSWLDDDISRSGLVNLRFSKNQEIKLQKGK